MRTQQLPELYQMARRVCDSLRDMIVCGEIEEGQRITEAYLSELFGVSRSPVREALRMLAYEGFVELLPYRGARVSLIREKNVREHYQLKAMLDGYSAYLAAGTFSRDDLNTLSQIMDDMARCIAGRDVNGLAQANTDFHGLILEGAGNSLLSQYYSSLSHNLRRYTELSLGDDSRWETVLEEHREIFRALEAGDSLGAFEAANKHALEAMERVMKKIHHTVEHVPGDEQRSI